MRQGRAQGTPGNGPEHLSKQPRVWVAEGRVNVAGSPGKQLDLWAPLHLLACSQAGNGAVRELRPGRLGQGFFVDHLAPQTLIQPSVASADSHIFQIISAKKKVRQPHFVLFCLFSLP